MHADVHKTIVIEMSLIEASNLYEAVSHARAAIKASQVTYHENYMKQLTNFCDILDDVRD